MNVTGIFQAVYTAGIVIPKVYITFLYLSLILKFNMNSCVAYCALQVPPQVAEPKEVDCCWFQPIGSTYDPCSPHQALPLVWRTNFPPQNKIRIKIETILVSLLALFKLCPSLFPPRIHCSLFPFLSPLFLVSIFILSPINQPMIVLLPRLFIVPVCSSFLFSIVSVFHCPSLFRVTKAGMWGRGSAQEGKICMQEGFTCPKYN